MSRYQSLRPILHRLLNIIKDLGYINIPGLFFFWCAAAAAKESSGYTEADFFIQLKTDTAFDSIDANYNAALASLDTALLDAPTNQTK